MARIIIVSNRLPITINRKEGELIYHPSAGGLATGLNSLDASLEKIWIGWPGQPVEDEWERESITYQFSKDGMVPVFLSQDDVELFYEGFSNKTIWPHFHYFMEYTAYEEKYWESYQEVNRRFAETVAKHLEPDDMVWVHDYQLMLVPGMLRENNPDLSIGFFLHIPFPSYEVFRTLPWRRQILDGILGADQIGFHTFGYMRHFLSAVYRITGHEHNFGQLMVSNRPVNVDVFPMGIDYEKYAFPPPFEDIADEVAFIREYSQQVKLILSIDRLDYSKGIPQRLKAYQWFLENNPQYIGKVCLILVVVPSRSNVDQYISLKEDIDLLVGRINGQFGTFDWVPVRYYYRSFPFSSLMAMYQSAPIALITPLRDGMNLVAKEFVAAKQESRPGVLILSEMAGAATELTEAIIINPNDPYDIERALVTALEQPEEEQIAVLEEMQKRLKRYTVKHWANNFIHQQMEVKKYQQDRETKLLNPQRRETMLEEYQAAGSRLLLLDYDGTLVGFHNDPGAAKPDQALRDTLAEINSHPNTTVVIISGRDRYTLGEWFGDIGIELVSEHGVWLWKEGKWNLNQDVIASWKPMIRPILENLVERTPGSFIEEKDYTLAWHYRRIDNELGANRVREIREELIYLTANHNLQVLEGNKVVEVRNAGVNKGKAASLWLNRQDWEFLLAVGDDHTDEDTFQAMPPHANTIKVGLNRTEAKLKIRSVEEVRELLDLMAKRP
ncbi:bifunctional alpha,alpha-trehalose-phosphate synthase (UDP-forming)/trehalose-phosphatase [Pontibacter sp. G13]|uniref:bifunctional alpha,alpha-trehalose-phosphate synthase (UDP-forming)/trehalose-phosphatase n=1 Tax=Pontibacter sp. G13 TaxID=3074898 RepID=UPI00288B6BBE|nr:bifunctional alpha,alpha-trehalose-phosphate synthase (UDP-forming)/trehalose-phosphatase [Pontibacter sp. G13]WNJ18858.1 bifunctional alpha,alpha-trehalose-phosphate synthase (UDP-forming)/trehalose-phosphatase [Pontibacter sp. G13]